MYVSFIMVMLCWNSFKMFLVGGCVSWYVSFKCVLSVSVLSGRIGDIGGQMLNCSSIGWFCGGVVVSCVR